MDLQKATSIALSVADAYQNIKYKDLVVSTPYFINTAEQVYKKAMKDAHIEEAQIKETMRFIKDGLTPLGSGGGKESPEEMTRSLERLMVYLTSIGYRPSSPTFIQKWMEIMHIGLDCSGYIYNILKKIEEELNIPIMNSLSWANPEYQKPSHAGAFIFDSPTLNEITDVSKLRTLDLCVWKNHTHVGMLIEKDSQLHLTDCALGIGIGFYPVVIENGLLSIPGQGLWSKKIAASEVVFRGLH